MSDRPRPPRMFIDGPHVQHAAFFGEDHDEENGLLAQARRANTELRAALDVALSELAQWRTTAAVLQQSRVDAWTLLGKVSYFLEFCQSEPAAARKAKAAKLRQEIKKAGQQ